MSKVLAKPIFFANPDKSHCVPACLKGILSVTLPDKHYSWDQLEKMTDYVAGHGAWVYAELLALHELGLEVKLVTGFNIRRFIEEDFAYIEDEFGKDIADYERSHPHDYDKLKQKMQQSLDKDLVIERPGTKADIEEFIDNDCYVMALVNSKALNNEPGHEGHRILIYGYDEKGVFMNDPGPTHQAEATHLSWELLDKAWPPAKEMIAVKRGKSS